ncbi:hypothetical protein D8674_029198 [Pyrus ussuriensis x Pyrus communis]|uniref:Uncharacterized protein n=1 Tax=Pyrus ussuriensis x Pyrus communis TaxID=2448454 RepID=A0A5N5I360_9ROSA|nr:hypothetical protein D8674_029198 [Pyrus ussuriensis x Pyrus communis]
MDRSIKTFAVILLLLFDISSGSRVKGFKHGVSPSNPPSSKVYVEMEMRELVAVNAMLDYEKPIPNPRHEKRPGGAN